MLQTIVSDNDLYRMFRKQGPDGIAAHRGDRNRGASTLENQYRFITRFSRRGFRRQQQRVMRRFTTISPRYHARAYTALCNCSTSQITTGVLPLPPAVRLPTTTTGTGARQARFTQDDKADG